MSFDATLIAVEAAARGDDELEAVIFQLGGYASTCWLDEETPGEGRIFDSDAARAACDSTVSWIRSRFPDRIPAGRQRTVLPERPGRLPVSAPAEGTQDVATTPGLTPPPSLRGVQNPVEDLMGRLEESVQAAKDARRPPDAPDDPDAVTW